MTTSQGKLGDLQVEEEGRTLQDDSDYLFKPPVCGYSYVLGPATAPRSWTLPVLFHRAVSNYTQVKKKKKPRYAAVGGMLTEQAERRS